MTATVYGLRAIKDPVVAKSVATATSASIADNILPWLKDQAKFKSVKEVEDYLSTAMCNKIPEQVKLAILAAFGVLDLYLPVPDAKIILTANQISLICSFMQGVSDGCQNYSVEGVDSRSVQKLVDNPSKKWFCKK